MYKEGSSQFQRRGSRYKSLYYAISTQHQNFQEKLTELYKILKFGVNPANDDDDDDDDDDYYYDKQDTAIQNLQMYKEIYGSPDNLSCYPYISQ